MDWFALTLEQKYNAAFEGYKEKFPEETIKDFHLMEIEFLNNSIKKDEEINSPEWWQTKLLVERKKLLKYFQKELDKKPDPYNITFNAKNSIKFR